MEEGEGSRIVVMEVEVSHSSRRTVMGLSSHLDTAAAEERRSRCMFVVEEPGDVAVVDIDCSEE